MKNHSLVSRTKEELVEHAEECKREFHWRFVYVNEEEFFELLNTRGAFILGLDIKVREENKKYFYDSLVFQGCQYVVKKRRRSYNPLWN